MLTVVLGPNKSGKSLFAEKLLAEVTGPKCYIATLPSLLIHRSRIHKHQQRRPTDWTLIELVGELTYDVVQLQSLKPTLKGILLDGLSVYLKRALPDPISNPMLWGQRIIKWLINSIILKDGYSIIVDCHPISTEAFGLGATIAVVHSILRQRAEQVYLVHQGIAKLEANQTHVSITRNLILGKEEFHYDKR